MKSMLLMLVAMMGCAQAVADEPAKAVPSSLQSFDASFSKIDQKLDTIIEKTEANTTAVKGLAETVGNSNAGHDTTQSLLRTLQTRVDTVLELAAEKATTNLVPEVIAPLKSEPPPVEVSDHRTVTIGGTVYDFNEFVTKWYVPGMWKENPNASESHSECLTSHHGVPAKEVECLNEEDQSMLHAAIHTRDLSEMQMKLAAKASPAAAAPAPQVIGYRTVCENGVCRQVPIVQQQQAVATSRREARKAGRGK